MRRQRHGRRGSATLETAVTLMITLTLMLAIVDLGRYVHAANLLRYLSREGTRFVSVRPGGEDTERALVRYLKARATGVDPGSLQIRTGYLGKPGSRAVSVDVALEFQPVLTLVLQRPLRLQDQSTLPLADPS